MLVNAVTYTFPDEKADEVERLLRELGDASRAEDGCAGFAVCRGGAENPGTFVLFETWRDQAALDAHYGARTLRPAGRERHPAARDVASGRERHAGRVTVRVCVYCGSSAGTIRTLPRLRANSARRSRAPGSASSTAADGSG